jgi:3-oxoacyl-[acyl-carrier protein] reductase
MDLKLTGKIALVTGSSRGIGLATAKAFAAEGCQVMLSGRSNEQLREAGNGPARDRRSSCGSRRRCRQSR